MKIKRDNDIIRAVGWVATQSSQLEVEIEEIANFLAGVFDRIDNDPNSNVGRKLEWIKSVVREIDSNELKDFSDALQRASELLDQRNKLIHGQIYFDELQPSKMQLRPNSNDQKPSRVTPEKVYNLAESLWTLQLDIFSKHAMTLLGVIKDRTNA
ncbi:hypothetical protein [Pelagicoccus sp. SDUM812003]|uniref:hypothetical protein n=1 Tax=Pelagicoccus sp. SDUM812003 TaxID=3041267 RepID=UPI00280CC757|nr:hypothetical protein [Pelagicoccus sp. SDUM812003]MDQ8205846.1 hypothetical protein [Pelagicoccus sp. SDUM812003]